MNSMHNVKPPKNEFPHRPSLFLSGSFLFFFFLFSYLAGPSHLLILNFLPHFTKVSVTLWTVKNNQLGEGLNRRGGIS